MDKIVTYFKEAKAELDKVIFPTRLEIRQSFISVVSVVAVVTIFLSVIDLIMSGLLKDIL